MNARPFPFAATGLLLVVTLLAARPAFSNESAESTDSVELATVRVQRHPVEQTFPVDGLLEAVRQASVAAQVAGRVTELRVDAGQAVKKGDLLLRIEAAEASEAVAGAAAQLANAKAAFERTRQLRQQNFVSQAALDKAKSDFEAAQAASGQARAGLGHALLRAPISGVVARRWIETGEMATPGKALLLIYDPASLRATASVPQYKLPALRGVKQAKVEFPELGLWVDAAGVTLLPAADAQTHVAPVRVDLPGAALAPSVAQVMPGMAARVHFVTGRAMRLTVPAAALVRRGEVAAVYVRVPGQARPVLRQLRLGEAFGGEVEVLAGLAEGERVVLEPVKAAIALRAAGSGK